MAEIIEIPVENNTSASEYTPQQVGGILGGILGGFILAGLLVTSSRKNEKSRSHIPKKDRKQRPDLNINDWDLDGLNDLFIQTGGTPQTKVFTTLLNQSKDDLGNITFNFNPNYSAVLEGETGALYKTVSDFNNDGLIDLYLKTVNYHGEEGNQPSWYIPGCYLTYDKLFLNTGNGFSKIEIVDNHDDGDGDCKPGHVMTSSVGRPGHTEPHQIHCAVQGENYKCVKEVQKSESSTPQLNQCRPTPVWSCFRFTSYGTRRTCFR